MRQYPSAGLILVMPLVKDFTGRNDLPEIQWRNQGETGGGHYEKRNALPKLEKPRQTGRGALWKTKCPPPAAG